MENRDIILYKIIKDTGVDSEKTKIALKNWVDSVKSRIELLINF